MKIALLLDRFPQLSETFILDQVTGLIDLAQDVYIFALNRGDDATVHDEVNRYKLLQRTTYVEESRTRGFQRGLSTLPPLLSYALRCPSGLQTLLTQRRALAHGATLWRCLGLHQAIQRVAPDVLLCHYGTMGNTGVFLKLMGLPAKIATIFHGFDLSRHTVQGGLYEALRQHGDQFLPISGFWRSALLEQGFPAQHTCVHHVGINTAQFAFRKREITGERPLQLLTVGRLTQKKGHATTLRALARLKADGTSFTYHIAGDGVLRGNLERLAGQLGLADQVVFHGAVARQTAQELFDRADVFILSSLRADDGDMEGIPVVLMEALAVGLPVVSTVHSGIPELVEHEVCGLLAEPGDSDRLYEAIVRLLKDPLGRRQMAQAGRKRVEQEFDRNVQNQRLLNLLEGLVQEQEG